MAYSGKYENASAAIDGGEVHFSFTFKNLAGSQTEYGATVRRSTLRFVEYWEFPEVTKKKRRIDKRYLSE